MCGGRAPAPPPAPDPVATAQAQSDANLRTARANATLNRVNQVTPFGTLTYTQSPDNQDQWTATQELSPDMQSRLRMVYDTISSPVDLNAIGATTDSAAQALMGRMSPLLDTQRTQMETRLRNQGLAPGSEAWTTAMRDLGMSENDARLAALTQADSFANNALSRAITARQAPLNEFTQLTGQNNFINAPQSQVAPTDVLGAYQMNQAAQNAAYQAKMQQYQANLGGLYGIGSAVLGAAGTALGGPAGGAGASLLSRFIYGAR